MPQLFRFECLDVLEAIEHPAAGFNESRTSARVRIISDNPLYSPYEDTAEEVNIIGRIRWYAREI